MPNSQKPLYSETPHNGGWIWMPASQVEFTLNGANPLLFTRNAVGDYSWNRTAGGAETYAIVCGLTALKRLLETVDNQEFAGSALLQPSAAGPKGGAFGAPPFTGIGQITPSAVAQSKGLRITDVVVAYQVGVAALTSAALSFNKTVFSNGAALVVTNIPISAAALPLTTAATPFVQTRAVTAPGVIIDDLSDLNAELLVVMQNTGTFRFYGIGFHCQFNYN